MTTTAVCRLGGGCDDLDHSSATGVLRQCRLISPHLDGTNPAKQLSSFDFKFLFKFLANHIAQVGDLSLRLKYFQELQPRLLEKYLNLTFHLRI